MSLLQRVVVILAVFVSPTRMIGQSDSIFDHTNRYGIWFIPSVAQNIYGIAIGPVGSEAICNRPYTKYSHGLNLQIPGQGFFQTFYLNKSNLLSNRQSENPDTTLQRSLLPKRAIHHGLLVSLLGTFTDQINGVSLSLWMSRGAKINGLTGNLLWNHYEEVNGVSIALMNTAHTTHGLQIGLFNKTTHLQGFQLGLWNKTKNRSFPFINGWFTKKKE